MIAGLAAGGSSARHHCISVWGKTHTLQERTERTFRVRQMPDGVCQYGFGMTTSGTENTFISGQWHDNCQYAVMSLKPVHWAISVRILIINNVMWGQLMYEDEKYVILFGRIAFFSPVYVLTVYKQDESQWLCCVPFHVFSVMITYYMFLACRYRSLCYWPVAEIRPTDQRLVWRGGCTVCVLCRYDASVNEQQCYHYT